MLFLILLGIVIIVECLLIAHDKFSESFGLLVVSAVLAWFFWPDFHAFFSEMGWMTFLKYVGVYLVVGMGVAFFKWILFNVGFANKVSEIKKDLMIDLNDASQCDKLAHRVRDNLAGRYKFPTHCNSFGQPKHFKDIQEVTSFLTQDARKHKGRISFWVLNWPLVVINLLIEDLIIKIGEWLSEIFNAIMRGISEKLVLRALK